MIKRIAARMMRFIRACERGNQHRKSTIRLSSLLGQSPISQDKQITGEEISIAAKVIVQVRQKVLCTPAIIKSMPHLNVRLDKEGLLRCQGRLGRSCLNGAAKHPLMILQNSWLSEAIIRDIHENGHPGIGHTIALVRQVTGFPNYAHNFNNLPYKYPNQSDLPNARVQRSKPFEHVGQDYFGPLSIKVVEETTGKCYGTIITCMITRLIHLD
ncbi:unnamed protein product, partial [Strongylus vulgaris]